MKESWMTYMEKRFGNAFKREIPLAPLTTLKVGGAAKGFLIAGNWEELIQALTIAKRENIPYLILGKGANLIIPDEGFSGLVIQLKGAFKTIRIVKRIQKTVYLQAGAGISLSKLLSHTAELGLAGLEPLTGIPATLGGAIWMNAGIQEFSISDALSSITCLTLTLTPVKLYKRSLRPAYRNMRLPQGWVVLGATFKLHQESPETVRERMHAFQKKRKEQLWKRYPSVGSIFKNPEGTSAGSLIEACGLKGFRIGGAQVSQDHANVIINTGNAKARDILGLIDYIRKEVYNKTGIALELEAIIARS